VEAEAFSVTTEGNRRHIAELVNRFGAKF
jgi:hypothetical protein